MTWTEEKKSMLAAVGAYSIFGLSYLFSKTALEVTDPAILLCCRFAVTVILMNLLVIFRVLKLRFRGKNLLPLLGLGLLQPVLYFLMENYGLKYTTTSFTGIVSSIHPIFTALLGVVLLREKPNWKQWICIGLSIVGVALVSLGSTGGENTVVGCLCLIGAYLAGSLYSIIVRKLSDRFSPFEMTYVMFSVGFVFFAGMAFVQNGEATLPAIGQALGQGKFIVSCLYLGGLASVGAYLLANYSLARLSVTRSTIFSCFGTIVSVLSGVLLMGDSFTVTSLASFVLILIGVVGVNRFAEKG